VTKKEHKRKATKWLKILRDGTGQYNRFICLLHKEIHKGGLTLTDIGTSRKELLKLRTRGHESDARKWIGFLRSDPTRSNFFIGKMNKVRIKGYLSLEEIGTSQEELSSHF